jgi:hypothetical protein
VRTFASMTIETKTRVFAGLAAFITGVMLVGATGLMFVLGWGLWAFGLVVLMAAIPAGGKRPPRGKTMRVRVRVPRSALVRAAAPQR